MEEDTQANTRTTCATDKAHLSLKKIEMSMNIPDNGGTIVDTDMVYRLGVGQSMKVNLSKTSNMAQANAPGRMDVYMKENGRTMSGTGKELRSGQMVCNTPVITRITCVKAKASSLGVGIAAKESSRTTRDTAIAWRVGKTGRNMMVSLQ